jgi:hypothetical protein
VQAGLEVQSPVVVDGSDEELTDCSSELLSIGGWGCGVAVIFNFPIDEQFKIVEK